LQAHYAMRAVAACDMPSLSNVVFMGLGEPADNALCRSGIRTLLQMDPRRGILKAAAPGSERCGIRTMPVLQAGSNVDRRTACQSSSSPPRVCHPRCRMPPDLGSPDLGSPDLGSPDLGSPDLGSPDLGSPDLGSPDLGSPDLGSPDLGSPDLGSPDLGSPDLGSPDLGSPHLGMFGLHMMR
jgi:hypothetical protein